MFDQPAAAARSTLRGISRGIATRGTQLGCSLWNVNRRGCLRGSRICTTAWYFSSSSPTCTPICRYRATAMQREQLHYISQDIGAGEQSHRGRDSLARVQRSDFRKLLPASKALERKKGRCPFPRAPIPEPPRNSPDSASFLD